MGSAVQQPQHVTKGTEARCSANQQSFGTVMPQQCARKQRAAINEPTSRGMCGTEAPYEQRPMYLIPSHLVLGLWLRWLKGAGQDGNLHILELLWHLRMTKVFVNDNPIHQTDILHLASNLAFHLKQSMHTRFHQATLQPANGGSIRLLHLGIAMRTCNIMAMQAAEAHTAQTYHMFKLQATSLGHLSPVQCMHYYPSQFQWQLGLCL